ncbi:hypothetical protein [Gordonia paraffinivorans]|uniref:hypothetical protein n=1 Tax=Gordonia paraffinivorans TaxID=175628 RepID=UPI001E36F120|nr:hypothetical protein [Gordonia paraffinivorans]MCD2143718.1 hypothetical protein [Gordonia paraffinivorans]
MVEEETRPDPNSRPAIDVTDLYSALPGLEPSMSHHKLHSALIDEVLLLRQKRRRGELVSELHLQRMHLACAILGGPSTKRIYDGWIESGKQPTLAELEELSRRPWFQDLRDEFSSTASKVLLWITAVSFCVPLLLAATLYIADAIVG